MTGHDGLGAMLADLGAAVAFPPTPPLAEAVAAGLDRPARSHRGGRWIVAAAVAATALAASLALPPVRQVVADALRIGPVTVEQVADLPPAPTVGELGQLTTLDAASASVAFPLLGLEDVTPDAVFLDTSVPGGVVTLAYGSPADGWRLLVTQFDGALQPGVVTKLLGPEVAVEQVTVGGSPALWVEGTHALAYLDADGGFREDGARLAGNTLIATRHGVPVRIEAAGTLAEAIRVAERLVPAGG